MRKITRREWMRLMALSAGGLGLQSIISACSPKPSIQTSNTLPPEPGGADSQSVSTQESATQPPADSPDPVEPTATSQPLAQLVVAHGKDPESLVRAALDKLGGMSKFVPAGGWVIVKPNICNAYHSYEYASTTNPWVVAAIVKLAFEAGAKKVQVMDSPFAGSASDAYVTSGIAKEVEAAGGEMVQMADLKFKTTRIEDPLSLNSAWIYEDVFNADALINVPIAKNHGLAKLTLGMKNLMGVIQARENIHVAMPKRLTDLNCKVKTTLTIIDAIRILVNNGPTGGDLADVREMDTLIASPDIVAADSFATTLFGMQPTDIGYLKTAAENGLGTMNYRDLQFEEFSIGG